MTDLDAGHKEFLELIPWYVNGTLPAHERQSLERHLHACLPCHSAFRDEQRVSQLMHAGAGMPRSSGADHGADALLQRIDRRRPSPIVRGRLGPTIRYATAAALGGAVVWFTITLSGGPAVEDAAAPFGTLSAPSSASGPRIDVVFADGIGAAERERLVAEIDGEIVGGPSEIGRYTIALPESAAADLDDRLDRLADDSRVRFAARSFIEEAGAEESGVEETGAEETGAEEGVP